MLILSERQLQIIEALWTYQYLTSQQMQRILGLQTSSYVNKLLKSLLAAHGNLLAYRDFGFHPWVGRFPRVYFLRLWGVNLLHNELGYPRAGIKHPRGQNALFERDLFHRLAVIDFHIQFRRWAEAQGHKEIVFRSYFEKHAPSQPAWKFPTALGPLIPDGVGMFGTGEKRRAFFFEQHNGHQTARAVQQIQKHMQLMHEGGAEELLRVAWKVGLFFVFEHASCMENTLKRLRALPEYEVFSAYMAFRAGWEGFLGGWKK